MKTDITLNQYKNLNDAYKYFNEKLFDNKLPECLITLNRKTGARGYYWHEKFQSRYDNQKISEIGLNPDTFEDRSDLEILSTLVHEQCHLYQFIYGEPSRRGYHNWDFAKIMENVGLRTTVTGEWNSRRVGQKMTHLVIEGDKFEKIAGAFLLNGNKFYWNSVVETKEAKERKKTREKFTCPSCLQSAQAKKTAKLMCGVCEVHMIIESE